MPASDIRLLRPQRRQVRWDYYELDALLPPDHRARLLWAYVEGLDLSALYSRIKARGSQAGRPASDPAVVLAIWLYATLDGVGSARAIERLCRDHVAYRWLAGEVPINHDLLSSFRRDSGLALDGLLTQGLTGLIAEGLLNPEEVAIDGCKVRARAGHSSLARRERLERIEQEVAKRVQTLRAELDEEASLAERKRMQRQCKAAEEQAARLARARETLAEREQEKAQRSKTHAKDEAGKSAPSVSLSDPEARTMRMADGAMHPAWNVNIGTADGFILGIEPTDRRNDSGLAMEGIEQIQRRGISPARVLVDSTMATLDNLAELGPTHPGLRVYSPVKLPKKDITPGAERNRRSQRKHEPEAVKEWRARMLTDEAKDIYRRRKLTEHVHAKLKNRGFGRMMVHGRAGVRVVCLLFAIAHNLFHALTRRAAAEAA